MVKSTYLPPDTSKLPSVSMVTPATEMTCSFAVHVQTHRTSVLLYDEKHTTESPNNWKTTYPHHYIFSSSNSNTTNTTTTATEQARTHIQRLCLDVLRLHVGHEGHRPRRGLDIVNLEHVLGTRRHS